jgi:hypothetical protein
MHRREFLETSTMLAGATLLGGFQPPPPMLGIQVGAVSFVDEGTPRVLDSLQEMAAINTVFVASFTYGRGIGGRQLPNQPLPDHGRQEYDTSTFRGGNYATPHPQYYRDTAIKPEKAPDHGAYDVLADVIPQARRRDMKVIVWFEDVIAGDVPGFDRAREVVLSGPQSTFACSRNPNTRNFWLGLVEDYLRSYDVDGLMWGSERQGPLGNVLRTNHGGAGAGGRLACFCEYCVAAAKKDGINVDRAREGYSQLATFAAATRDDKPLDGAFVTFWRLLVKYPEILAWEKLWNDALNDTYRDMHRRAHEIAPDKGIGWHVWHNNSFSPFYRAEQDYADFGGYSDFLKVVMYNLCGGERLVQYVRSTSRASVFGDLTPEQTLDFTYAVQHYTGPALDALAATGLPASYVERETARAVRGARSASGGASMKIWPGIDVDIPTAATSKKTQPDDVYAAVKAAFAGGAHGVLLSRKYSEMRLDNIRAAGRAVRDLKLV